MRARKTETEIRQEQILQAALELIGAEGAASLSIAGIAKRVGIVPSALYRHFQSKDAVLDAILESIRYRLMGNVTEVMNETPGALQRLESLLMRHARLLSENRAIPYIVFSDGFFAGHPERKKKVSDIVVDYLGRIQIIVEEGMRKGSIRKDVVPATISMMFLGMILPVAMLSNIIKGHADLVAHAESAWPVFARSISVKCE